MTKNLTVTGLCLVSALSGCNNTNAINAGAALPLSARGAVTPTVADGTLTIPTALVGPGLTGFSSSGAYKLTASTDLNTITVLMEDGTTFDLPAVNPGGNTATSAQYAGTVGGNPRELNIAPFRFAQDEIRLSSFRLGNQRTDTLQINLVGLQTAARQIPASNTATFTGLATLRADQMSQVEEGELVVDFATNTFTGRNTGGGTATLTASGTVRDARLDGTIAISGTVGGIPVAGSFDFDGGFFGENAPVAGAIFEGMNTAGGSEVLIGYIVGEQ